jgi:hypothetical protein
MFSRATPFRRLVAGDIFHARGTTGSGRQSLICLVVNVTDAVIRGRTVTHSLTVDFDRSTGKGRCQDSDGQGWPAFDCVIDSIEPLPVDMHNVLLGLDRKMRLTLDHDRFGLNEDEKSVLDFVYDHYKRFPITQDRHEPTTGASR